MAPFMSHASILEAVSRLAEMDPLHFRDFNVPDHWQILQGTRIYENYTCALKELERIPDGNIHIAQLQQKFAVHIVAPEALDSFMNSQHTPKTAKAIVKTTVESPIAKQLFIAIPTEDGLQLSSTEMRISLCLLLGVEIPLKSEICDCSAGKKLTLYHALSCKKYGQLITRHELVKEVLGEMCKAAQLSYRLEPHQAFTGNKLRPDIIVDFGKDGYDVSFDLTIHNPLRDDPSMTACIQDDQNFLRSAANTKNNKYQPNCAKNGSFFTPIVLSAFGGIADDSYTNGIKFLLDRMKNKYFSSPNWAAPDKRTYWLQRIAIALWLGNAKQMGRFILKKPIARC